CFLREFFHHLKTCSNSAKQLLSSDGKGKGVRRAANAFPNSPWYLAQGPHYLQLYGLFTTTCGAGLLISSCALTFWICAACSFSVAMRLATVASNFSVFLCSLRNSLSNIAFTAS